MQEVFIWLAILTFFLVAEAVTVQLTTIWFAGGALVAALAAGMEQKNGCRSYCFWLFL